MTTARSSPEPPKRYTLKKTDVLRMLMTMDRYQVDSVVVTGEENYLNWELPQARSRSKKSARG